MRVFTVGFKGKTAQDFFEALKAAGIKRLVDVRLSNNSQIAGFSKRTHMGYLLKKLCRAEYVRVPLLAPTKEIRDAFLKEKTLTWAGYKRKFRALLKKRKVEDVIDRSLFDVPTVLLCSEQTADECHRRLVAEYLAGNWGGVEVEHL